MYRPNIYDLDELLMMVNNKASLPYITDAVKAYYGGAYRAAIVSTWIAVMYDFDTKNS